MNRRKFILNSLLGPLSCIYPLVHSRASEVHEPIVVPESTSALRPLKAIAIAHRNRRIFESGFRGHAARASTNIKSASKSILSALCGIAIDQGVLSGPGQRIAPILKAQLPKTPDPRIHQITVEHLLTMRAGLASTSGRNYGAWVQSKNWVKSALAQPFVDEPGGGMIYSSGTSHLLAAVLTKTSGRSLLALAREWLAPVEEFRITGWDRDPQGIYFGGNQMAMSARSLLAFGELYRRGGLSSDGHRILSEDWIKASWQTHTQSVWTGDDYGYGWFLRNIGGHPVHFGWGFGGQMIYVVPDLSLSVAIVSDSTQPSARTGYRNQLHRLLADIIILIQKNETRSGADTRHLDAPNH